MLRLDKTKGAVIHYGRLVKRFTKILLAPMKSKPMAISRFHYANPVGPE
jgi:hypothetical protein